VDITAFAMRSGAKEQYNAGPPRPNDNLDQTTMRILLIVSLSIRPIFMGIKRFYIGFILAVNLQSVPYGPKRRFCELGRKPSTKHLRNLPRPATLRPTRQRRFPDSNSLVARLR
jgi:hypothetical protein